MAVDNLQPQQTEVSRPNSAERPFYNSFSEYVHATINELDGSTIDPMFGLISNAQSDLVGRLSPQTAETTSSLVNLARKKREQYLNRIKPVLSKGMAEEELRNGTVSIEWYNQNFLISQRQPIGFNIPNSNISEAINISAPDTVPSVDTIKEGLEPHVYATQTLLQMDGSNPTLMNELISQVMNFSVGKTDPKTAEILMSLQNTARERRQIYLDQIIEHISRNQALAQLVNGLVTYEWFNARFPEKESLPIGFNTPQNNK